MPAPHVPGVHRRAVPHLSGPLLLTAAFAAQAAGALRPNTALLAAAVLVSLLAEGILYRWQRRAAAMLARVRADAAVRQVLRDALLVAALLRLDEGAAHDRCLPLVFGLLCFYALHFGGQAAALLVHRSRTLPVVTRNIDTSALALPPAPPALLTRRPGRRILLFGLPATVGLCGTAVGGSFWWAAAGVAVSTGCAAAGLGILLARLLPGRRPADAEQVLRWLDEWLATYRPTVGLYFSGGASSAYQANMWLRPLARLDGRPVIVLRERFMVQKIGPTDIPIVCIPRVAHLMRLEHSTLRVLIHPANSGKTSQILRIPTLKHAFVNHGESDKLSSCNPYAKVYDEVWVAGSAARARYALADVGVDDRDVVEIGRPQLDAVLPRTRPPGRYVTVLYAPTWEGWDGQPGNTSLILAGENIVRALLADPGVRLLYRPHPMTGSVDARAALADARIRALVAAANAAREADREADVGRRAMRRAAAAELDRRAAELRELTDPVFRPAADDMERMSLQGTPAPGRAAAVERATAAWEAAYWASLPAGRHQVVSDSRPGLYSCFNQTDLLISDVSSVVADYLASGKPYAVTNTSGLSEDAFRAAFPTVRAATVLAPDAAQVPQLLRSVRDPRLDELAAAREELREELLGPPDPPPVVRFAEAARALAREAAEHRARMARRSAAAVPGQAGALEQPVTQESADIPGQQGPASRRQR